MKLKKIVFYLLSIPKNLFTNKSIFSIILNSKLAKKTAVLSGCRIYNTKMDNYSYVGRNSVVINCEIGKFTSIANNCNIGLANHELTEISTSPVFFQGKNCLKTNFSFNVQTSYEDTIIGNDVWIGANVLVKGGIKIGDGAVVGAGSVVTKDVPSYAIVAGNPAKLIRYRFDELTTKKLLDEKWWNYREDKLRNLNLNKVLNNSETSKILVLSVYAAPYRVGVFEELSKTFDLDVFFEHASGDKRNTNFFKNKNALNSYIIDEEREKYQTALKNIKQYDLVLVYDYNSLNAIKLMLKCIKNHIPYFINCDGYLESLNKKSVIKTTIKKYFVKHATRLLANGSCSKQYFLNLSANEENIDIHHFSSLYKKDIRKEIVKNKNKIKEKLGLSPNRMYLSVGSFDYRKGFDLLLDALLKIQDKTSQYVLIGGGEFKSKYEKMIKDYKLDNVKLIDFLDKEALEEYYNAADAFILPTREDIWGLVINEAMSYGLPVISTDNCGAALEMINNENGTIIKTNSVGSLIEALNKFNNYSDEKLQQMGKEALKVAQKYNIEDIVESHVHSINKVVKR